MFVRKDLSHAVYKSVCDLPTMNWLLRHEREGTDDSDTKMGAISSNGEGGVLNDVGGWAPMGTLRNTFRPGGAITSLFNVDVWGRTKTACCFGDKLVTGDRVGYGLCVFDLTKYEVIDGPGAGSRITEAYLMGLSNDDQEPTTLSAGELLFPPAAAEDGKLRSKIYNKKIDGEDQFHVYQWMPLLNGKLAPPVWKYFPNDHPFEVRNGQNIYDKSKPPEVDFVSVYSLGCVSNSLHSGRAGEAHIRKALQVTDRWTTLPQIEVILE